MSTATHDESINERLRGATVAARAELEVSRHVFRDGVAYVLRDPISFSTNRLAPGEYAVLSAISDERSLGETFEALIHDGVLEREDEDSFYAFVLDLHQKSLLSLPINDGDALYRRHERRRRAKRIAKIMGVFFLRIPLVSPDAFLARTVGGFRWLFSLPAFVAYVLLLVAAGAIAISRFDDLTSPFLTMVSGSNAILLILSLVVLKVIHEFGHAYACKVFGGHVPEMGVFLVLFTPCAYVDATDSWSFPSPRRRAIVTLAGLYFETIVGATALIVWAFTGPSTVNTIAYQVALLATVVTLGFNLNPLMRYDAYYLVADLTGLPNLRARSTAVVHRMLKRSLFGLRGFDQSEPPARAFWLGSFGVAQSLYRVVIMVSIAAILVIKFGVIGRWLAAALLGMMLWGIAAGIVRYIVNAEEMRGRRIRGAGAVATVSAAIVAAVISVPIPTTHNALGVSSREHVVSVRSPVAGFIERIDTSRGDTAGAGETLVVIDQPAVRSKVAEESASLLAALRRADAAAADGPAAQASALAQVERIAADLATATADAAAMTISAPIAGKVIASPADQTGRYIRQGDPIATIATGPRVASFLIPESSMDRLRLREGDHIRCRSTVDPARTFDARVTHIDSAASRTLRHASLSAAAGGPVAIDPSTGDAAEPVFEIRLALPDHAHLPDGATVHAQFPTRPVTIADAAQRRVVRFLNNTRASGSAR